MSTENRAARLSVHRTASVSRNIFQSATLFAEPPVALPNLDELRATDALVRAYYDTFAKPPAPSGPPIIGLPLDSLSAPGHASPPPPATSPTESTAPLVLLAERRAAAEVIGAALARTVVESAARLYTSRQLDDLVETYTACATWDDARDVVAGSFLPQDLCGSGLGGGLPALTGAPGPSVEAPLFLRSALSLAGIATRTPTCTLTPHSSLTPPPLGTTTPERQAAHDTRGPVPPACVPMDAYARYVTVVEEAPMPTVAADRPSSQQRALATRPRATKAKVKAAEVPPTAAAGVGAGAAVTAVLSPSPPIVANVAGKRGGRGPAKGSSQLPQSPPQPLEASHSRGKTIFGATAKPLQEDPLTRALRQGGSPTAGPAGSPLPAVPGAGDGEKRGGAKPSPRAGGGAAGGGAAVVAVEQDRLLSTDRGTKALLRGAQRKDAVRCRVLTGEGSDVAAASRDDEAVTAAVAEAEREPAERRGGKRSPSNAGNKSVAGKGKKGVPAEGEAWTASFFNATDAAGEASLHDQVQVTPSPGVTVVGGATPPSNAQTARRGHKAAAGVGAVVHGGDFTIPADRLALSALEEKRVAARKPNGSSHAASNPGKARPTAAFKTV